jgi:hypothetical protein
VVIVVIDCITLLARVAALAAILMVATCVAVF